MSLPTSQLLHDRMELLLGTITSTLNPAQLRLLLTFTAVSIVVPIQVYSSY